jgi:hypothetical protein
MTQALYAHMSNKTIKKRKEKEKPMVSIPVLNAVHCCCDFWPLGGAEGPQWEAARLQCGTECEIP